MRKFDYRILNIPTSASNYGNVFDNLSLARLFPSPHFVARRFFMKCKRCFKVLKTGKMLEIALGLCKACVEIWKRQFKSQLRKKSYFPDPEKHKEICRLRARKIRSRLIADGIIKGKHKGFTLPALNFIERANEVFRTTDLEKRHKEMLSLIFYREKLRKSNKNKNGKVYSNIYERII